MNIADQASTITADQTLRTPWIRRAPRTGQSVMHQDQRPPYSDYRLQVLACPLLRATYLLHNSALTQCPQ